LLPAQVAGMVVEQMLEDRLVGFGQVAAIVVEFG